jgi:hypothetical protein
MKAVRFFERGEAPEGLDLDLTVFGRVVAVMQTRNM